MTRIGHGPEGWDVWTYHLEFPRKWLESGLFANPLQRYGDQGPPFYPLHASLLAWTFMAAGGGDLFARFAQVPFVIAGTAGFAATLEILGAQARSRWFAISLWLSLPIVLGMTVLAQNDLSLAGAFIMACAWIFIAQVTGSRRDRIAAGLATGLLLGIKSSALPFSIAIVAICLFGLQKSEFRWRQLSLIVLLAVLFGSFTYVRNWIIAGNPVYPIHLEIFGHRIASGAFPASRLTLLDFHTLPILPLLIGCAGLDELGIQGWILIAASIIAPIATPIIWNWRRVSNQRHHLTGIPAEPRMALLVVLLLPMLLFAIYLHLPYRYHVRFFLPAAAAATVNAGLLYSVVARNKVAQRGRVMEVTLLVIVCLTWLIRAESKPPFYVVGPVGVAVACFPLFRNAWNERVTWIPKVSRRIKLASATASIALILVLSGIGSMRYREQKWDHVPGDYGSAAQWITRISNKEPLRIAFAGINAPYPLSGKDIRNSLVCVPKGIDQPTLFGFGIPFSPTNPPASRDAWLTNLHHLRCDLLFTSSHDNPTFPDEDTWARDTFTLVFRNDTCHIFAISENGLLAAVGTP